MAKTVLILRMLFAYPVIVSWMAEPPSALEAVVLIVMGAFTLMLLARWDSASVIVERHPALALVDIILSAVVLISAGADSPYFLYLSATAVIIGILYVRLSRFLLTLTLLVIYIVVALVSTTMAAPTPTERLDIQIISTAGSLVLLVALVYIGSSLQRLQDQVDAAVDRASVNASEAALGEERSRMARELHDSTVKSLVGIELLAKSIRLDPKTSSDKAALISTAAHDAITESRAVLRNLRTDTVPTLQVTLHVLAAEFSEIYPVRFDLDLDDEIALCPDTRYALGKIAQEAMANASRHSGTDVIRVELRTTSKGVRLVIRDFGQGISRRGAADGHYGLKGMRERATELGATISIQSPRGGGTAVVLGLRQSSSPTPKSPPAVKREN